MSASKRRGVAPTARRRPHLEQHVADLELPLGAVRRLHVPAHEQQHGQPVSNRFVRTQLHTSAQPVRQSKEALTAQTENAATRRSYMAHKTVISWLSSLWPAKHNLEENEHSQCSVLKQHSAPAARQARYELGLRARVPVLEIAHRQLGEHRLRLRRALLTVYAQAPREPSPVRRQSMRRGWSRLD